MVSFATRYSRCARILETQSLVQLTPVTLAQSLRLELADEEIGLKQSSDRLLHVFKRCVLAHSTGHFLGGRHDGVELLPDLARLHACPQLLAQLAESAPDARESRPYSLQIAQLFDDRLQTIVLGVFEI